MCKLVAILSLAAAEDHTDADCFGCALLSHGKEGIIAGTDRLVCIDALLEPIKMSQSLVGKPKLFFVQVWLPNIDVEHEVPWFNHWTRLFTWIHLPSPYFRPAEAVSWMMVWMSQMVMMWMANLSVSRDKLTVSMHTPLHQVSPLIDPATSSAVAWVWACVAGTSLFHECCWASHGSMGYSFHHRLLLLAWQVNRIVLCAGSVWCATAVWDQAWVDVADDTCQPLCSLPIWVRHITGSGILQEETGTSHCVTANQAAVLYPRCV